MDNPQSSNSQNMLTFKKLKVEIFNSDIWFYRGKYKDFLELLDKENKTISGDYEDCDGLTFNYGSLQVIWVDQQASLAIKMHEYLHAVLNICDEHGLDRNDDELLCYLLEFLVKSL